MTPTTCWLDIWGSGAGTTTTRSLETTTSASFVSCASQMSNMLKKYKYQKKEDNKYLKYCCWLFSLVVVWTVVGMVSMSLPHPNKGEARAGLTLTSVSLSLSRHQNERITTTTASSSNQLVQIIINKTKKTKNLDHMSICPYV